MQKNKPKPSKRSGDARATVYGLPPRPGTRRPIGGIRAA
jgi:hypothetical protein